MKRRNRRSTEKEKDIKEIEETEDDRKKVKWGRMIKWSDLCEVGIAICFLGRYHVAVVRLPFVHHSLLCFSCNRVV